MYSFVKKLSFSRVAGTAGCADAASLIEHEVRALGGTVLREDFTFPYFTIDRAELSVTSPYEKSYAVTGIGYSGNLSGTFPFRYVERATPFEMEDTEGAFLLMNHLDADQYRPVVQSGGVGFMTPSGKWYDDDSTNDLTQSRLGSKLREIGIKPGLRIRCSDAIEMVRMGAREVHVELQQHEEIFTTQNLYTVLPGELEEIILFSAHYDSVLTGVGAYDNATGCASLLWLYRYFREHKPRHTMVFLWCGAEEEGLLGSREFVRAHPDMMEKTRMAVNFDLTGCVLGYDGVSVAAPQAVCDLVKDFADRRHHTLEVRRHAASSDSTSFAGAGIPAFNFYRYGEAEIHNRHDQLFPLSGESMEKTAAFAGAFVAWCDEGEDLPFAREALSCADGT